MGDILYHADSSLPGVLGFGIRITASCKDIDPLPFAACVVNPSLWLMPRWWSVNDQRRHLRHLACINLAFFNCGCHGGMDSREVPGTDNDTYRLSYLKQSKPIVSIVFIGMHHSDGLAL